ncbi:hypothetical protein A0U89_05805 [Kozakia baliensis]|uniref:Uncharacterized protein n=1 Tax=Kozakia baliensis TaxID=153496 RepID=A0A1D8USX5_9PROT|nr:hypothetical protein A0U89_05805 [Kozakia baliensis]
MRQIPAARLRLLHELSALATKADRHLTVFGVHPQHRVLSVAAAPIGRGFFLADFQVPLLEAWRSKVASSWQKLHLFR